MGAINENYRRMWKIKFEIFKKDKTLENLKGLKNVVAKRIEWANKFLKDVDRGDWSFPKWWTRLDLIKCLLQINNDKDAAEKCAGELHEELLDESADIGFFTAFSRIQFDRKMSKQNFVKCIVQKFK